MARNANNGVVNPPPVPRKILHKLPVTSTIFIPPMDLPPSQLLPFFRIPIIMRGRDLCAVHSVRRISLISLMVRFRFRTNLILVAARGPVAIC
ncbi:hypothetical protein A2U01_0043588 [Trifolium medium]|uniref:Uncharacterized protein n=1 Tax=Trifolium medium TaxID=97028 RepID=A0A392QEY3_9FABA|nr:hypothetical protein [Trifolium medium]